VVAAVVENINWNVPQSETGQADTDDTKFAPPSVPRTVRTTAAEGTRFTGSANAAALSRLLIRGAVEKRLLTYLLGAGRELDTGRGRSPRPKLPFIAMRCDAMRVGGAARRPTS